MSYLWDGCRRSFGNQVEGLGECDLANGMKRHRRFLPEMPKTKVMKRYLRFLSDVLDASGHGN